MSLSPIAIGFRGVQMVTNLTQIPINILENPLPSARHMIIFVDLSNFSLIGSLDMYIIQGEIPDISFTSRNCSILGSNQWSFKYIDNIFVLNYQDGLLYLSSSEPFPDIAIRDLMIPGFYCGPNSMSIDFAEANNPIPGSSITLNSPLYLAYNNGPNLNCGQSVTNQLTSITTQVTINPGSSSGKINTVSASTSSQSTSSFIVNNIGVSATSVVIVSLSGYSGSTIPPMVSSSNVVDGSFHIHITNFGSSPLDGIVQISFLAC